MNLNKYIKAGLSIISNDSFILEGETIDCVFNTANHSYDDKKYGFPTGDTVTLVFQTADYPTIKDEKGNTLTHKSKSYRINEIHYGDDATTLILIDSKKL